VKKGEENGVRSGAHAQTELHGYPIQYGVASLCVLEEPHSNTPITLHHQGISKTPLSGVFTS
jgi:hypothetical protein